MKERDLIRLLAPFIPELSGNAKLSGFTIHLDSGTGQSVEMVLPKPAGFDFLPAEELGLIVVNDQDQIVAGWGMLQPASPQVGEPWRTIANHARRSGHYRQTQGAIQFVAKYDAFIKRVTILAVYVEALSVMEQRIRSQERSTSALTRVGKVLSMNQTLLPLAVSTVHTIVNTLDLQAILLWVQHEPDTPLKLIGHTGIERHGLDYIKELNLGDGINCLAEAVMDTQKPIWLTSVNDSDLTKNLEAKYCCLQPGPIAAIPLSGGTETIGVLELVGKADDQLFLTEKTLHITLAEHLSLALKSALLFEKAEMQANIDPLTGISNHRTMQDYLARRLDEASRNKTPIGVVMIDVDHFRQFNEQEGHDAGDAVLRMVAKTLHEGVRSYDLAARYGGEEFTLILPGLDGEATKEIAERIRNMIAHLEYRSKKGSKRRITASLGCSSYPESGSAPQELLKNADIALYKSKEWGRNQVQLFDPQWAELPESA